MATPGRGETGLRRRWRLLPLVLVGFGVLQWVAVGAAEDPTIEPVEGPSGFYWAPSTAPVATGGSVTFRSPSKIVPHGVSWAQGPGEPSCSGVPVDSSGTEWSGRCTFAQGGSYAFVCPVHPEEMKGSVVVGSGEGAPAPPSGQAPDESERAFTVLRLARSQRGGTVRGSLAVSPSAAGGKLILVLRAKRSSLGGGGRGTVRVGHARRPLRAGRQPFAVALGASAKQALHEVGRLPVTVIIAVVSPNGQKESATRRVELHG